MYKLFVPFILYSVMIKVKTLIIVCAYKLRQAHLHGVKLRSCYCVSHLIILMCKQKCSRIVIDKYLKEH